MTTPMNEQESIAERAAQRTIEGLFLHLGIDIKDPEALKQMKEDLAFLARMGRGAREVKSVAIKTCVGSLIAGLIALLGIGIKDWIQHP